MRHPRITTYQYRDLKWALILPLCRRPCASPVRERGFRTSKIDAFLVRELPSRTPHSHHCAVISPSLSSRQYKLEISSASPPKIATTGNSVNGALPCPACLHLARMRRTLSIRSHRGRLTL